MLLQPNVQETCTVAYSTHGMNISVLGQRSRSQSQKQNFCWLFFLERIQLNGQTFSNQTNTKHVSHDKHSTRAKQR